MRRQMPREEPGACINRRLRICNDWDMLGLLIPEGIG